MCSGCLALQLLDKQLMRAGLLASSGLGVGKAYRNPCIYILIAVNKGLLHACARVVVEFWFVVDGAACVVSLIVAGILSFLLQDIC